MMRGVKQLFYDCDCFSVCLCKLDITSKATDDTLWLTLEVFVSLCHHMSDNLVDDMAGILPVQCKTSPALLLAHGLIVVIEEAFGFHRTCKIRRMGLVVNPVFRFVQCKTGFYGSKLRGRLGVRQRFLCLTSIFTGELWNTGDKRKTPDFHLGFVS